MSKVKRIEIYKITSSGPRFVAAYDGDRQLVMEDGGFTIVEWDPDRGCHNTRIVSYSTNIYGYKVLYDEE